MKGDGKKGWERNVIRNVLTVQDFSRKDIASFGSLFFTTGGEERREGKRAEEREKGWGELGEKKRTKMKERKKER